MSKHGYADDGQCWGPCADQLSNVQSVCHTCQQIEKQQDKDSASVADYCLIAGLTCLAAAVYNWPVIQEMVPDMSGMLMPHPASPTEQSQPSFTSTLDGMCR